MKYEPPLNPKKLPLLNTTPKCSLWCLMGPICSTVVHSRIHLHYMCKIDSQSIQSFDHNFSLLNGWSHKTTHNAALWYGGANCLSLCPFPDESTDVYQIWCQSVQPFDSFPRLLNVWPPTPPPPICPWGIEGWLVFSLCPFPDESADVNQSWCQSDKPFDIFPWLLNCWPPNSPPPPMSRGELYLAYVHSQTNPQTCTKCGANRSSRLTASQDFWMCDPLTPPPPKCPLLSWGSIGLAYIHSQMNLHMCAKFGVNRSSRLVAFPEFVLS